MADLINAGLLIVAVVGIWLTYLQLRTSSKTQKATFFKDLYTTMFADAEIRNAYYKIEYGEFNYGADFHGSKDERMFDHLLSFVDLICELYAQGTISDREMRFFKYELTRINRNDNIKRYLDFLTSIYKSEGTDTVPFPSFSAYCKKSVD
jgi:hypothetical protein